MIITDHLPIFVTHSVEVNINKEKYSKVIRLRTEERLIDLGMI